MSEMSERYSELKVRAQEFERGSDALYKSYMALTEKLQGLIEDDEVRITDL